MKAERVARMAECMIITAHSEPFDASGNWFPIDFTEQTTYLTLHDARGLHRHNMKMVIGRVSMPFFRLLQIDGNLNEI